MASTLLVVIASLGLYIASKFKLTTKSTKSDDCRLVILGPFLLVLTR